MYGPHTISWLLIRLSSSLEQSHSRLPMPVSSSMPPGHGSLLAVSSESGAYLDLLTAGHSFGTAQLSVYTSA